MNETSIAYCAGLFDGEGCILLSKHYTYANHKETAYGRQPNYRYRMDIRLNQTRPESVIYLQETLGGTVYFLRRSHGPNKEKIYAGRWCWEMADTIAAHALEQLLPFLRIKKDEAELALQFQASKFPALQRRGERGRKLGRTPEEVAYHQWCFEEMKRLKQVHNDPAMQEHYILLKDSFRRQLLLPGICDLISSVATRTQRA